MEVPSLKEKYRMGQAKGDVPSLKRYWSAVQRRLRQVQDGADQRRQGDGDKYLPRENDCVR